MPQTFTTLNRSGATELIVVWLDESVSQALVISFMVIVGQEVLNSRPQRTFPEQDHSVQARFLYGPNKSLRVGVQIRCAPEKLPSRFHAVFANRSRTVRQTCTLCCFSSLPEDRLSAL